MDHANGNIASDFTAGDNASTHTLDFSHAERVESTGSTCDAFVMRYNGRRVFVKRLKSEHSGDPTLVKAFEKEFELGVRLKHKSLPHYYELTDSAIVMEYISGNTLEAVAKSGDRWLAHENNVRRMLLDLIDVVDYLHQNHIVHCDIKADNVMLTNDSPRVLMLIDLGFCYTDCFDTTSGTPGRYGKYKTGDPAMDYAGIGRLIQWLAKARPDFPAKPFRRFEEDCFRQDVEPDDLRELLITEKNHGQRLRWIWPAAAVMVLAASGYLFVDSHNQESSRPEATETVDHQADMAQPATTVNSANETGADALDLELENYLPRKFAPLLNYITEAENQVSASGTSDSALLDTQNTLVEMWSDAVDQTHRHFAEVFPDMESLELQMRTYSHPRYLELQSRFEKITQQIADEMRRRHPDE